MRARDRGHERSGFDRLVEPGFDTEFLEDLPSCGVHGALVRFDVTPGGEPPPGLPVIDNGELALPLNESW